MDPRFQGRENGFSGDISDEEGIQLLPLESMENGAKFDCEQCNFSARSKRNLRGHIKSFHTEKQVVCDRAFCDMVFPTKFMMKVHLADCYLKCAWSNCEKKFKYQKIFDRHQRAHEKFAMRLI